VNSEPAHLATNQCGLCRVRWTSGEDKQAWAFQQIADRLEGKPVQVVDATADDNRTINQFSDAELSAVLRRRVGVVSVESDEERPERGALN
jgi:hypothetical protein